MKLSLASPAALLFATLALSTPLSQHNEQARTTEALQERDTSEASVPSDSATTNSLEFIACTESAPEDGCASSTNETEIFTSEIKKSSSKGKRKGHGGTGTSDAPHFDSQIVTALVLSAGCVMAGLV